MIFLLLLLLLLLLTDGTWFVCHFVVVGLAHQAYLQSRCLVNYSLVISVTTLGLPSARKAYAEPVHKSFFVQNSPNSDYLDEFAFQDGGHAWLAEAIQLDDQAGCVSCACSCTAFRVVFSFRHAVIHNSPVCCGDL